MSLEAYLSILLDWEGKLESDIAIQYATMKARRMVTRTKLTKTISSLSKTIKGTSINVFEIKNCLKTVYTWREDLEIKDFDCQILMTDQMEVLDADAEISQQGWMEPALKVISRAQRVIAQLESAPTVKGKVPGVSKSSMVKLPKVNLPQFHGKLASCQVEGNICYTDGQSSMDCRKYIDAEGALQFKCLEGSSETPTTQTNKHLKTLIDEAQCRGQQETLKTTVDGALDEAWVSKEVKECLKMMEVDSEPRGNEVACVNLTKDGKRFPVKAYDIDGPILEPVSAKKSDSTEKLDDGQFVLEHGVKFARSLLNVSHEQEMLESCTYFAQLESETVVHAVTTPVAHTAVATGNAKTYTVETGVMNGPVMIPCVERDTTLEEFNGNFASPTGFANEAQLTRMLINKQRSAAACFESRGFEEEFAQPTIVSTLSGSMLIEVQEHLSWTKMTKDGAIGPPSPNPVNIQKLLTWIAVIAVFTLILLVNYSLECANGPGKLDRSMVKNLDVFCPVVQKTGEKGPQCDEM